MKAAGLRGTFGFFYCALLLVGFDFVKCKYNGVVCRYGVIEDWDMGMMVIFSNPDLLLL